MEHEFCKDCNANCECCEKKNIYNKALEDFAENFKAHCRKFTVKSISDKDVDWVKNELSLLN